MTNESGSDPSRGKRLTEVMAARGVRPKALAEMVGVRPESVSRWRRGASIEDWRLERVATALGTTPAWLAREEGPRDAEPGVYEERMPVAPTAVREGQAEPGALDPVPIARGKAMVRRAIAASTDGNKWVPLSTVIQLLNEMALEWAADRQSILAGPSGAETARIVKATQEAPGLPGADLGKAGSK